MTIERNDLSVDAVKINGSYIEDLVTGYTTVKAVGRETVERSLETNEPKSDGSILKNARYADRQVEVSFVVQRSSLALMRESMGLLKSILDVKGAEIIFNGDSDFFYIGTPTLETSITEAKYGLIGTFIINCLDPFKYSVTEYEATPSDGQFTLNYDGTYKSFPTFVVDFPLTLDANGDNTNTSECGYIGFANARGNVLQFGDPEETDYADIDYPATNPLNRTFKTVTGWTVNGSKLTSTSYTQTGSMTANSSGYCYASGYGSGTSFHGPSISYILNDVTDSKNFKFTWKQKFVGTKKQFGAFECLLWNNNSGTRTLIGAVSIRKTTKDTKTKVFYYANGSLSNKHSFTVACSKIGTNSIVKDGANLTITVGGTSKPFVLSDTVADLVINEVTFWFGRNASKTALGTNQLYNCSLTRYKYTVKDVDIQNMFQPGDKLNVDCKTAAVTMDSGDAEINAQSIGALGNDWEQFYLTPGTNVIAFDYSEWATTPPVAKMKYRKVYL